MGYLVDRMACIVPWGASFSVPRSLPGLISAPSVVSIVMVVRALSVIVTAQLPVCLRNCFGCFYEGFPVFGSSVSPFDSFNQVIALDRSHEVCAHHLFWYVTDL
ncbi:hypothetical protein HanIR_Chr01g0000691 [Helianthus annuus]|nr:hypothetical protein HanIR_Chr01g0000691 [Helianthus annuus]